MKDEQANIDELLNSFIDGELTERQRTEVQRLVLHNEQIARRLSRLEQCRVLVGALPSAEAPSELGQDVKVALERRTLLGPRVEEFGRAGTRHLMVRRLVAAAAMIGLVGLLAVVVYTIVAVDRPGQIPVTIEGWQEPLIEVEPQEPQPAAHLASAEKPAPELFNGRLELRADNLVAVEAFINKAIEENGLLQRVGPRIPGGESVFAVSCGPGAFSLFLTDLAGIWDKFDSAKLFVETADGRGVLVEAVNPEQVSEIVSQDNTQTRIEVAKNFAVLNSISGAFADGEIYTGLELGADYFPGIPKPVLTSGAKTVKEPAADAEEKHTISLTVRIISSK